MSLVHNEGIGSLDITLEEVLREDNFLSTPDTRYLQKVMKQYIPESSYFEINNELKKFFKWIKEEYLPLRKNSNDRAKIFDYLCFHIQIGIEPLLSLLWSVKRFRECTVMVLAVVTNLHLLFIQDAAVLDPQVAHPTQSAFYKHMIHISEQYARRLEKCFRDINTQRLAMISQLDFYVPQNGENIALVAYWTDKMKENDVCIDYVGFYNNVYKPGTFRQLRDRNANAHKEYIESIKTEIFLKFGYLIEIRSRWRTFVGQHCLPTKAYGHFGGYPEPQSNLNDQSNVGQEVPALEPQGSSL